jgi:predicted membrane channel-forming protein YqfA (hemolysin III family)
VLFILWPKDYQLFVKIPFRHLDYIGAVLVLAGTVLPVFIINQAAIKDYAWDSATTIIIFVLGGLCWVCLIIWQRVLFKNPKLHFIRAQLPWGIISSRVMVAAIL